MRIVKKSINPRSNIHLGYLVLFDSSQARASSHHPSIFPSLPHFENLPLSLEILEFSLMGIPIEPARPLI